MARYVVARIDEIPAGTCRIVTVRGREIGIFNINESFYGLINRCPHQGAPLCEGAIVSHLLSSMPGDYRLSTSKHLVRCPWHCWEFDIISGKSLCDPDSVQARAFNVEVEAGTDVIEGTFVAETVEVSIDDRYIVVTL